MGTQVEDIYVEDSLVQENEQQIKEEDVVQLFQPAESDSTEALRGKGFSYRHDWGNKRGTWDLTLRSRAITRNSRVFVSTSEGAPGNRMFIGSASYTVHNVAPYDGGVKIRIHIAWKSKIRVTVNYLIINP